MCGIAGILSNRALEDLNESLSRMQRALGHRGPDDQGMALLANIAGGLVHTRLSILDLSAAGHQPMLSREGRFTITFNGEIYNFRELREELVREGIIFQSQSDTEVILRLYERCGPACVERLRGMFAFAIWDAEERTCFLARDPFGIKPLYYHQAPGYLIFASELRAILASELVSRKLSPKAVFGFFQSGSVPEPNTVIEGVYCLSAGHSLLWKEGRTTMRRFWPDNAGSTDLVSAHDQDCVTRVREALIDSVQKHFVSDVPVGIFLSGGIDSTTILALARVVAQSDLRTFSISFDDPALNEGDIARRTAQHFATEHADLRLNPAMARTLFKEFIGCLDQPSIDGFNTFTVSRFARDQGMKVVLSGLGGDELFGGYPSFSKVPQMVLWSRRMNMVSSLRIFSGRLLERHAAQPQLRRLGSFLQQPPSVRAAYQSYRGIYSRDEACALAAKFAGPLSKDILEAALMFSGHSSMLEEISELELQLYMRNQLLRDSDVMSMASGLELRVPFVDRCLIETLAGVRPDIRFQAGKRLLLQAVPEVPEWVASQPKRGFTFPFEQWLAGDWKEMFEAAANRSGVRAQTWYQKWSLFVLEAWCSESRVSTA